MPPGWLTALARNFDDPSVGAVVPVYTYPDGRLQEAGAIVESDGRVVPLGVDDDPGNERWSFSRIVTYGSAACMLVRRSAFEAIGGFDPIWGCAYYEDVDLAFRLRELGLSVRLDASVRVVHAQGASAPSTAAAQALRDANQARFRDRWRGTVVAPPDAARRDHRPIASLPPATAKPSTGSWSSPAPIEPNTATRGSSDARSRRALAAGQVTVAFPDEHDETEVVTLTARATTSRSSRPTSGTVGSRADASISRRSSPVRPSR